MKMAKKKAMKDKAAAAATDSKDKTKREEYPDLAAEREAYDVEVREEKKRAFREAENARLEEERAREADRDARDYKHIMDGDKMMTNKDIAAKYESVSDYEDDFM